MAIEYFPNYNVARPRTRIQVDSSALTGSASDSEKTVMLIGSAHSGKPNTVYLVRNLYDAKQIFRGGDLVDAMEMAWNPSNETAGAGDILAMRVEDATASTLEKGGVTFQSTIYGEEANQTQVALETAELNGNSSRNLTVSFTPDNYREVFRNVGDIIYLTKTEDAPAYVGVEIANNKLTVSTGADEATAQTAEFPLGTGVYSSANNLLSGLNTIPGIEATVPGGNNKNINTNGLDDLDKTEITADRTVLTGLLSDLYNILKFNEYVTLEVPDNLIVSDADPNNVILSNNIEITDFGITNLDGGTQGTIPSSWANKFYEFSGEGGYYLVPLTSDQAIHAEAGAFVNDRDNNGEPMRVIVGAGYDEPVNALNSRSAALRNPRVLLVGFSGTRATGDGRVIETPAYMYASQVAGVASGLEIGEAITYKQININGLSTNFSSSELDALNTGGVVMAQFVRNRISTKFRIVDDVTTYNDSNSPLLNQMGVGEASDFLKSELRTTLDENFIGTKVVNLSPSLIKNHVQSFLDQKKRDNEIQDYTPEDVQVIIRGEIANISLTIFPVRSLKEINVTMTYNTQVLES